MSRSLMTGITGLRTHQQKLDVVANNLANLNTTAYKAQSARFSDLIYNTVKSGSAGESTGGTNAQSIGTGVQTAQITRMFTQGALESTGQVLDFAILGEGFFAVKNGTGENLYTRAGSFGLDGSGRLVDPATGNLVQRIGVAGEGQDGGIGFQDPGENSISVPLGAAVPGQATSLVEVEGNLPSSTQPPATEIISSASPFATATGVADATTLLSDLTTNDVNYGPGDTIEIVGTNPNGLPFGGSILAETATLGDLVTELNNLTTGATAEINPDGTISITADGAGDAFLSLVLSDGTNNVGSSSFGSNPMVVDTDGNDGDKLELSMEVFDVRGESHRVTLEFSKVSINSWDVSAALSQDSGTLLDSTVLNLTFNDDGTFALAGGSGNGDTNIEISFDSLATPQTISLDLSSLSHLASEYSATQTQDGFPPGNLVSVAVSAAGELSGLASNGRTLPLAQLALASFRNTGALDPVGGNYFQESINSGVAAIGAGLTGDRGQVASGQLEGSNVDIAQEFTQLIIAQRGFSANARTITVTDEILEELTNIVR